ncbi:MAG: thioredoxin family protein [Halobacteria archaeon]|nr:thioredoxin family protein [Halobacteria archaeon]
MVLKESDSDLERGDRAPDFSLRDTNGDEKSVEDFSEYDALLVVFTCNHCPYAKAKIPVLNSIADDYEDVAVVGINPNDSDEYPDDSYERMQELVEDGEVRYDAYLRDETQEVADEYGAVCTPDPFLFENQNGEFRLVYHGRIDDAQNPDDEPTQHEMRDAIDSVLGGDEVEVEEIPSRGCSIKWKD